MRITRNAHAVSPRCWTVRHSGIVSISLVQRRQSSYVHTTLSAKHSCERLLLACRHKPKSCSSILSESIQYQSVPQLCVTKVKPYGGGQASPHYPTKRGQGREAVGSAFEHQASIIYIPPHPPSTTVESTAQGYDMKRPGRMEAQFLGYSGQDRDQYRPALKIMNPESCFVDFSGQRAKRKSKHSLLGIFKS